MSAIECDFCSLLVSLGDGRTSRARRDGEGRGHDFRVWHHDNCAAGDEHGCNFPWLRLIDAETMQELPSCYERFDEKARAT